MAGRARANPRKLAAGACALDDQPPWQKGEAMARAIGRKREVGRCRKRQRYEYDLIN